jgi:hypothetical protein
MTIHFNSAIRTPMLEGHVNGAERGIAVICDTGALRYKIAHDMGLKINKFKQSIQLRTAENRITTKKII